MNLLVILTLVAAFQDGKAAYPRSDLLVEIVDLKIPASTDGFRILDARPAEQYRAGHLPYAVWIDHAKWSKAFATAQDADDWARRIGELGIDLETKVVIYDDANAKDAARMWWILRYWGVEDVRLLSGGWKEWQRLGGDTTKQTAHVQQKTVKLTPQKQRLALKDHVLAALKSKDLQIVDARSKSEHCGNTKTAKRSGTIPGAAHRDWEDLVDKKTGKFKNAAELAQIFNDSGIALDRPTTTYCQSGGRSSVMAFALELMGATDVRNYYQSWAEWGNADDTPIVKPDPNP